MDPQAAWGPGWVNWRSSARTAPTWILSPRRPSNRLVRSCGRFWGSPVLPGGCRLGLRACRACARMQDGRPGKRSATGRSLDAPVVREILGSPEGIAGRRLPPDPAYGAVQSPRKDAERGPVSAAPPGEASMLRSCGRFWVARRVLPGGGCLTRPTGGAEPAQGCRTVGPVSAAPPGGSKREALPAPQRHDQRRMGDRIVNDHAAQAVNLLDQFGGDNLFRRPSAMILPSRKAIKCVA
jgi:hypothetical protein